MGNERVLLNMHRNAKPGSITIVAVLLLAGCIQGGGPRLQPTVFETDFSPRNPAVGQATQLLVTIKEPNEPKDITYEFSAHLDVPPEIDLQGSPYWNGTIRRGGTDHHAWSLVPRSEGTWTLILNNTLIYNRATSEDYEVPPNELTLVVTASNSTSRT